MWYPRHLQRDYYANLITLNHTGVYIFGNNFGDEICTVSSDVM